MDLYFGENMFILNIWRAIVLVFPYDFITYLVYEDISHLSQWIIYGSIITANRNIFSLFI